MEARHEDQCHCLQLYSPRTTRERAVGTCQSYAASLLELCRPPLQSMLPYQPEYYTTMQFANYVN